MSRIIGVTVGTPMSVSKIKEKINPVTTDELHNAVETALQEAKDSGEFKGQKGDTGANGVSATHSWNGTTLTITSASGTSSANLKGEKGDTGAAGSNGKTPVKGTDYWTASDKAAMVNDVLAALPTWTGGSY